MLIAASLLALATAAPYHRDEVILKGPSGIITPHGPIGPTGPAHGGEGHYAYDGEDDGQYHEGHYDHYDDGQYHGEGAYYHHAPAVAIIAPAAHYHHAPAHHDAGYVSYGHHGVAVKGPHTVPALVAGPSGKVYAHGLYGVPNHHYDHHHYWSGSRGRGQVGDECARDIKNLYSIIFVENE